MCGEGVGGGGDSLSTQAEEQRTEVSLYTLMVFVYMINTDLMLRWKK